MWVWRDEMTPGDRGGWRLDAYGTWTWDAPPAPERESAPRGRAEREPGARERVLSRGGDRAIAAIGAPAPEYARPAEYTPIFSALTEDRTRRRDDDRWAGARVPEPHPGSGALPVQGLAAVPTVPPPPAEGLDAVSPEDEMRRRAERRRRPRSADAAPAGGRHTLLPRDEPREGRHTLRR